ncbi:RNA-binding Raly-like protein isoform X1 [Hypomesus transpacificus]|uniref:RNA-binding Raly-like protein isoform X1 n=1 Tax=Hypomesus transpacificus TaxID=137520 RepID=UPI001F080BBD|nr:RNA-binding Raly-like protein isoform X1 [Hypomesus transpacificus]XP_046897815.1 RNA-binding Raly-like protein isoform X1 [Hypomesus transpacificus]XP_046897816.1 RNA-binding Raly-like protein isoform X1 [Hypomesus transpacificus]XP_046897817.1 RNA-binding Raly-like protein isoform X1 [Hypomesus transpacificus]
MTLFKSEHRSQRYMSMSGELKTGCYRTSSKRPSNTLYGSEYDLDYDSYQEDYYDRVYDYQRVPASMPPLGQGPSEAKRPRSSSTSSRHRHSRDRPLSKSFRAHNTGSIRAKLKMNELQVIKKELTLIKTQIDGLLHSLDRMDSQNRDHTGSPLREDSLAGSPYPPSASSPSSLSLSPSSPRSPRHRAQRESPELGEASDDYHHTINKQSSGPEDEM